MMTRQNHPLRRRAGALGALLVALLFCSITVGSAASFKAPGAIQRPCRAGRLATSAT